MRMLEAYPYAIPQTENNSHVLQRVIGYKYSEIKRKNVFIHTTIWMDHMGN
jgi:hypothetical protein